MKTGDIVVALVVAVGGAFLWANRDKLQSALGLVSGPAARVARVDEAAAAIREAVLTGSNAPLIAYSGGGPQTIATETGAVKLTPQGRNDSYDPRIDDPKHWQLDAPGPGVI